MQIKAEQLKESSVPCSCGRSPTGVCIGWHSLSDEEFQLNLEKYIQESLGDISED